MPQVKTAQLRLRRAFRYGYFAFVAVIMTLLALLGLWTLNGDLASMFARSLTDSSVLMMAGLLLGLCVPLFFAAWLLIGKVVLGVDVPRPSLMDGIRD